MMSVADWLSVNADTLSHRYNAFVVIANELAQYRAPHIVETGGLRSPGNVTGDGNSTLFFNAIVNESAGRLVTIDIDSVCADNVAKHCSSRVTAITGNSLIELPKLWHMPVNCLYLDSYDVDFDADEPAARHALTEYLFARKALNNDALVCVDDNDGFGRGKGRLVGQLADLMRWECLQDGYVKVWRTNGYL